MPKSNDKKEYHISNILAADYMVRNGRCSVSSRDEHTLCDLDLPVSSITRSQSLTNISSTFSPQRTRRRRWSIGAYREDITCPDLSKKRGQRQDLSSTASDESSEAPTAADMRIWCEELCRKWTEGFSEAYWDLGQVWKTVCFAQSRAGYGIVNEWDKALRAQVLRIWHPLSDFHYVVQIYHHLADARNCRLYPELTARYLSWMTTEQMMIHSQLCPSLVKEGCASLDGATDNSHASGDVRMEGSIYPLTTRQLFRVARICNDVEWEIRRLLESLDEFKRCRSAFMLADERRRYGIRQFCTQRGGRATRYCLERIEYLVATLEGFPVLLCEAMGLDTATVPSCCDPLGDDQEPHMSGAAMTTTSHYSRQQDESKLQRSFEFQRASLQIGRVALNMNRHVPFLSREAAKRISRRMLVRSENLVNQTIKAGERRTEAKMRRLSGKIKDMAQRADNEALPETISLLDSVTWPAVLAPRSGDGVRTYDELARLPLETLLDNLDSLLAPAKMP